MPLVRKGAVVAPSVAVASTGGLNSAVADERWSAARALGGDPGAVGSLAAALSTEADARVREAIFSSLAGIGTPPALAAVIGAIRSDDAQLRTGALDALRPAPELVAGSLAPLLEDPDSDVRLLACELVRHQPSEAANRLLCDLLGRELMANVCAAAIEVLAEIATPEALPALQGCAARFADEPFLVFSISTVAQRLGGQTA